MNGLGIPVLCSLLLLAGSVWWDWTRESRMDPCETAQLAYAQGRAELAARGENPDTAFPWRPECGR